MHLGSVFFLLAEMSEQKKIAILGPGLLGGSIALSIKSIFPETPLSLWGRREEVISQALDKGIDGATTDLNQAVEGASLVILATPVGIMPRLIEQLNLTTDTLYTDVGSVKRSVHDSLKPYFKDTTARFIGSHPMAGSEKTGFSAAREDLVEGAACIITNEFQCVDKDVKSLSTFWQLLGMKTRQMSAEDHDYAVARISHFPHILASVGATVGLAFEDIAELAGGGMRDTTRIAAGDPALWKEILLENADALKRSLGECQRELELVQSLLDTKNADELFNYLERAKRKRDLI